MTQGPVVVGAGVILMRADGPEPRYLLLCGRDTGIWSFPKGHPEPEDAGNLLRTAIRETWEETGLRPEADYTFVSPNSQRFGKRPYWIATVRPETVRRLRLSRTEHSMAGWFLRSELEQLRTNVDVRAWIKKAQNPMSAFTLLLSPSLSSSPSPSPIESTRLTAVECSAS